jgi:hypothetical protein
MTPITLSETPACLSLTISAGERSTALLFFFRLLMIRPSDIPPFTNWMTESTGEAAFGAAAFLGAVAGAGACANATVASMANNMGNLSFTEPSS